MRNALSGTFIGIDGTVHVIIEGYMKKGTPLMLYRKDRRNRWRYYGGKKYGRRYMLRSCGILPHLDIIQKLESFD